MLNFDRKPPTNDEITELAQRQFALELHALGEQFWHDVLDDKGSLTWDATPIDRLATIYEKDYGLDEDGATNMADETYADVIKRRQII